MGGNGMNRWRQRLAELQREPGEQISVPLDPVRNVQNVQNLLPERTFEHSEQFEHFQKQTPRGEFHPEGHPGLRLRVSRPSRARMER
jgi:hypothetical protein